MDQKLYDLLKRIENGEQFFRPADDGDEANIAFKSEVNRLRELKRLDYIQLSDKGFIKNHTNGKGYYNIVGPCEITYRGEQALEEWMEQANASQTQSLQKTNVNADIRQNQASEAEAFAHSAADILKTRLQHLSDNIAKDFKLLKEYEDELRLEDEPRRRARYANEIEKLKASAQEYAREYADLENKLSSAEISVPVQQRLSPEMSLITGKLDALLEGQTVIYNRLENFGWAILNRYDSGEQNIIKSVVEKIDEAQARTVESVLDAVEQNRICENEMQEVLETIQQALIKIEEKGKIAFPEQKQLVEVVNDPQLNVKHRLKMTIPVVPLLLNYETELELTSGLNLERVWKNLTSKFSRK